jgi:hypothetical protein
MSRENVEVVRQVIAHVNKTGEAGPLELYDPAVTFKTRGDVGGPETFSGHRGMADAVARFAEVWAATTAELGSPVFEAPPPPAIASIGGVAAQPGARGVGNRGRATGDAPLAHLSRNRC